MITPTESITLKYTMSTTASSIYVQDFATIAIQTCPSWFKQETFENVKNISIIVILGLMNAIIILGNLLVVMAVFASAKLRTVTNFLIVSLAISDLLVGLAVLPYSITLEVLELWIFGELWCQMWLAVDVWLCTASILNLCAISIDRYLAITRPVHYRTIMSNRRVKLLIAVVWVLSFIICFPPLVGWNDRVKDGEELTSFNNVTMYTDVSRSHFLNEYTVENKSSEEYLLGNITVFHYPDDMFSLNSNNFSDEIKYVFRNGTSRRCPKPQCALITNPGYVIYSALGSFYIPMLVMLFFYYRIYVVALKTSRALDRGFRTAKSGKAKSSSGTNDGSGSADVTLRIHRGRPANESISSTRSSSAGPPPRRSGDILVPRRIPTVVYHHTKEYSSPRCFREENSKHFYTTRAATKNDSSTPLNRVRRTKSANSATSSLSFDNGGSPSTSTDQHSSTMDNLGPSGNGHKNGKANRHLFTRMSKRNARWHAKRFRTEAKATKTVGIIVGGFIMCWLPFFTVYLIMGFCEDCIPELLFKVFFYLGYCNSALNPIIYGMVSKDFRFAFKKILCRCKLKDDGVTSLIRQIHMPTFFEEETLTGVDSLSQN
ncbi:probable G-protein coupled receptor No9 [Uloborus diversus]|uniref:probable G-protein coupled receptor No9 n=1 Tax=Uloborus diversus TaxID=327109 RepID=UPI00240960FC|nr:probable G-protein coupled receptor No9 [Uloborus diversus]